MSIGGLLLDFVVSEFLWLLIGIGLILFGFWVFVQGKKIEFLSRLNSPIDNIGVFLMLIGGLLIAGYYFIDTFFNNFYFRSIIIVFLVVVLFIFIIFKIPMSKR